MPAFVDTSALYAALDGNDDNHETAVQIWRQLAESGESAWTTNYVLVETVALVSRRLGLRAVRDFQTQLVPLLRVQWVEEESLHERAMGAMITAGRRDLSLVDCVSFAAISGRGLDTVFAFDAHFAEQGFKCEALDRRP